VVFPFGLFDFTLSGCTPGALVNVQIVYTQPLPAGTRYWKYGPTPGGGPNSVPHWYVMPGSSVNGNTATFAIRDGDIGDDDLMADGIIVDQGGPAAPASASAIPTLNDALLAVLALMMIAVAWISIDRRRPSVSDRSNAGRPTASFTGRSRCR
jgi:hypothetical protein